MNKFKEKEWFIGGDLSKATIDYSICAHKEGKVIADKRFSNDVKGFEAMLAWLKKISIDPDRSVFCFEHTGNYGLLIFSWLAAQEIDYAVEPALQIKRSIGMTRGKNDSIDARRIAQYAFTHKDRLEAYEFPAKELLGIKQQLTYRDQLIRQRTGLKNSLKAHLLYEQVLETDDVSRQIASRINELTSAIEQIELKVQAMIQQQESLRKNFQLACSVKGIGLIIAAHMLISSHNFKCFNDGRKYACYAGIAPFEHSSGKHIGGTRVSALANKRMKSLISNGANTAIRCDPELKRYYQRKRAQGKDHKLVINSVCCKLVNRVMAVVKRGTPFVSSYANSFGQVLSMS
jgi:transposase